MAKRRKKEIKPTPKPSLFFGSKSSPRVYEDDLRDQSDGALASVLIEDVFIPVTDSAPNYSASEDTPSFGGFGGGDAGGGGSSDNWAPDNSSSSYDSGSNSSSDY